MRATEGDPQAQYAYAALLSRSGRRDDAERWLRSAAQGGCADAIYTLATRYLGSLDTIETGAAQLAVAASNGSNAAARQLAVLRALGLGVPKDESGAVADEVALARSGDAFAQAEIACLLAMIDRDQPDITPLAVASAASDPAAAAFLLARAARRSLNAVAFRTGAEALARARYPRAERLAAAALRSDCEPASVDWMRVEAATTLAPSLRGDHERICASPDVVLVHSAIEPEICEYVIARSAPRLGPSLVYDPRKTGMIRDPLRTSQSASLGPIDLDLALIALNRVISAASGCDEECGEFLSVLHYSPGQQYRPHFDCIPDGPDLESSGQRIKTALLFLNDDYGGGATHFLSPDVKVKGKQGDILVFSNVGPDGAADLGSRHAGLPVENGEKWLASKWFRSKKFRF